MGCIGGFVGIPVFCDSGFIILSRLVRKLAQQTGKSPVSICIAMAGGLYTTHVLVPPTPGPLAAAAAYSAAQYLGAVILTGLILSVPGILTGYWWAVRAGRRSPVDPESSHDAQQVERENANTSVNPAATSETGTGQSLSLLLSLLPLVLPVLLIAGGSVAALMEAPSWILFICKRSEEHTSELQSLMRISYAVFCLKKKKHILNMI